MGVGGSTWLMEGVFAVERLYTNKNGISCSVAEKVVIDHHWADSSPEPHLSDAYTCICKQTMHGIVSR